MCRLLTVCLRNTGCLQIQSSKFPVDFQHILTLSSSRLISITRTMIWQASWATQYHMHIWLWNVCKWARDDGLQPTLISDHPRDIINLMKWRTVWEIHTGKSKVEKGQTSRHLYNATTLNDQQRFTLQFEVAYWLAMTLGGAAQVALHC